MEFGFFMEFGRREGRTELDAFRESFDLVDASEAWGLDSVWLAEFHFNPVRSVLSSPIVVASSIATRTRRMRIGLAVYVLPLNNPLRIAEEVATVDQISEGRFDLGIGRSGFARSYNIFGMPYNESRGRFTESLEILRKAWTGKPFSYHGEYFQVTDAVVSPRPYQTPHPPLRMAAVTPDTFPRVAEQGFPIFVGLRGMDTNELRTHIEVYRKTWQAAGHPGNGSVYLRVPVYAAPTQAAALEDPFHSITYYFNRQSNLVADDAARRAQSGTEQRGLGTAERLAGLTYDEILQTKVAFGSAAGLTDRLKQLQEELWLDGIVAELNPGGLLPEEKLKQSLKIITHDVMPAFK